MGFKNNELLSSIAYVFNFSMVDGFTRVMDRQSFQRLGDKVFADGITWGKIVTLICVVGKAIVKVGLCSAFFTYTIICVFQCPKC